MIERRWFGLLMVASVCVMWSAAGADELSIYDVQYTADPAGASPYDGQIHNVTGGIVTHVWHGWNDRVYLYDPAHPTWGSIVVKDAEGGELSNNVSIGDWVSLDNIYIEEYRGTTFLQYRRSYAPNVSFTVDSSGNPTPAPALLTAADLIVPPNHLLTEPYESMLVMLEDVTVGQMDLGKASDNYELLQGTDIAWAADYMNIDAGGPYHPSIHTGAALEHITGIVEQYTNLTDGWDYYQLLTRSSGDIVVPEPASLLLVVIGLATVGRRLRQEG
jgi:hypothetical protein